MALSTCTGLLPSVVKFRSVVSGIMTKVSQPIRGRGNNLFFPIGPKTQTWYSMFSTCFLSSFIKFHSGFSKEDPKILSQSKVGASIFVLRLAR